MTTSSLSFPGPGRSDSEQAEGPEPPAAEEELIDDDLLVEDVSIDGMCGVY